MDSKILIAIVICLLCSSSAGFMVFKSTHNAPTTTEGPSSVAMEAPVIPQQPIVVTLPPPPPPTTSPPITTSPPARNTDVMVYAPGMPYVMYPPGYWGPRYQVPPVPRYPEMWWPERPKPIQPGGSFPELVGKDKDDAISYVMSTYPNMTVAAVRYGAPTPTDYRTDRFVLVYDAYTRKVVSAVIG